MLDIIAQIKQRLYNGLNNLYNFQFVSFFHKFPLFSRLCAMPALKYVSFSLAFALVQYLILCYGRNYLYDDIDRICIFSPDCSSISYKMAHFNQCIFLNAYFVGHDGMCYANVFDLLEG